MSKKNFFNISVIFLFIAMLSGFAFAQGDKDEKKKQKNKDVRPMTIPISIFTNKEIKEKQAAEIVEAGEIIVNEDNDNQVILSIRSVSNSPLSLAVLIQDDLSSDINVQLQDIKKFIKSLPKGSRVMVAYLRSGTMEVRQKFTVDLDEAADSVRIVSSNAGVAPRNPYDGVIDTLKKFESLPNGRRAILLISDGLDASNGISNLSPTQSIDLDKAILRAQRNGVAVYSFYASASLTQTGNSQLVLTAQSSLNRLSEETGGRAFFQGTFTAVSFEPFFKDLNLLLNRQFALTYLSTHMKKGYHKVKVYSTNEEVRIEHPKGYYYR